jgi:peptide/nickel transport system ATP-binding protein
MPGALLEIENLSVELRTRRGVVHAVDDVSLVVERGETVALVGESGCGKTMTCLAIMRLLPSGGRINGGRISIAGSDVTDLSERRMRQVRGDKVGMVFQDPSNALNPTLSIGEQIAEPVRIHRGASGRQALERAAEVLGMVGVPNPAERLSAFPHELSGGLRQRVAIAVALACSPSLVIADEPTTALDVTIQAQIVELLDSLRQRLDLGLLLITHDLSLVAERADRVLVMYGGRIAEAASVRPLFRTPRHPYTVGLLRSIPGVGPNRNESLASIPGAPPDLMSASTGCRFAPRCPQARPACGETDPKLEPAPGERTPDHTVACLFPVAREGADRLWRATTGASTASSPAGGVGAGHDGAGQPVLVIDHAVKEYRVRGQLFRRERGSVKAVSDVSLTVFRGETLAVVGESGSGKSTLARLMVGLDRPDSGTVTFDGQDLYALRGAQLRRARGAIQLMFQDTSASFDPRLRVGASLREPLQAQHRGSRKEQERRVRALLKSVGLPDRSSDLYPHEFSGGQRQRIGLARALTIDPEVVIADEPVSALDVSVQATVLNLMRQLQREHNLTYVVISHDLAVVSYLADRVGVMYLGQLVELGPRDDIYSHPAHPYTAALLGAQPFPDPEAPRRPGRISGELPSAVNPPSGCRFHTRCPKAQSICATTAPEFGPVGDTVHSAACHFPLTAAEQVEVAPTRGGDAKP